MLKKTTLLLLSLIPLFVCSEEHILIVADPHVLAESLIEPGSAFDEMMDNQRKMIDLSESAFVALVDTAMLYQPSLVLIPGDLTKDSEMASHDVVLKQLNRMKAAGINVLVIPGNHDIGGQAYAYQGDEKVSVENLTDDNWESKYSIVYDQVVAKDINSHSYVAEPLRGVTILGIDASHNAGEGYLSEATLSWLLLQADSASLKGNMIIAMCHWHVLNHVDEEGVMMESGRLTNADAVRDSLMAHDVHLLLTGHMHVNSISTYRDTIQLLGDSIVEISTGAPITYPCPYRWLTISDDRSTVNLQTENINALPHHKDMYAHSRVWMTEHLSVLLPSISIRIFDKAESAIESYIKKNMPMVSGMIINMLKQSLPQTDEEKVALVEKYLGSTIIALYLLHSDANEPTHPEADSLAQAMYDGVSAMIHDKTDAIFAQYPSWQQPIINAVLASMEVPIQSMVEDCTDWASKLHSDCTDDLQLTLVINEAQPPQSGTCVESIGEETDITIYDLLGRHVSEGQKVPHGIYIQNGKKIIR